MNNFEAIIFDLGGVLLNIDFGLTQRELEKLGMENVVLHFGKYAQAGFFDRLDRGEIDEKELFRQIRGLLPGVVSDDQIRLAWNAMILDFPAERIQMLKLLKETHRLFLLSNTNSIHFPVYNALLKSAGEGSIESFFDRTYLSFREGLRKPESEFFEKVITENSLDPSKTLFIDDTEMHVEAAQKCGIFAVHLADGKDVKEIF